MDFNDSFGIDVQKRIYLRPNSSEKGQNIRIEEMGKEKVLPHKMSPWIIENIFKIQRAIIAQKTMQSKKQPQNVGQMLQLKQDINGLKKDLSVLAANVKNKANK